MKNLTLIQKALTPLHTNCYFIHGQSSNETLIIDPADHAALIQEVCTQNQLKPIAVLLTHGHFDHIMAADEIRRIYGIPLYAGFAEKALLSDAVLNCSSMMHKRVEITADQWLNDHDVLTLAGFQIEVIATPGHTPGSLCYYFKDENTLFSGDTLFRGSFGRTDFPLGNQPAIYQSITQKLFSLPAETVVYPGHDRQTTIAYEKQNNIILTTPRGILH